MLISNLDELQKFASKMAQESKPGTIIGLKGDLGAGKTTFSKLFINYFFPKETVTSPTFNIVQYYEDVAHYDLYRINHTDEFLDLDIFEDFKDKICLIEWPEKLGQFRPDNMIMLEFKIIDENKREITIVRPEV